jgi:hypothetical protein
MDVAFGAFLLEHNMTGSHLLPDAFGVHKADIFMALVNEPDNEIRVKVAGVPSVHCFR